MNGNSILSFRSTVFSFSLIFLLLTASIEVCPQSKPIPAQSPASQSMTKAPEAAPIIIQTDNSDPEPDPAPTPDTASSDNSDVQQFQKRIERARALAAAHQLTIAANELESVRKDVSDDVVRNVTSVMLMAI